VSVVVSDTSPLHYLILCGAQSALPSLFQKVVIPPTVFRELQQPNTPPEVREWASALPSWVVVQTPKSINLILDVDAGELEAICLAQEIKAAALLIDDRAGRKAAIRCGLAVIGTIGILEQAAARGLLELPQTVERLRQTNARLDPDLIHGAPERDKARKLFWEVSFRFPCFPASLLFVETESQFWLTCGHDGFIARQGQKIHGRARRSGIQRNGCLETVRPRLAQAAWQFSRRRLQRGMARFYRAGPAGLVQDVSSGQPGDLSQSVRQCQRWRMG